MTAIVLEKTPQQTEPDRQLMALKDQTQAIAVTDDILIAKRQQAAQELDHLRLPNKRDEEWQFTDLSDFKQITFSAATVPPLDAQQAETFYLSEAEQSRLVFVNGVFAENWSDVGALPDRVICDHWGNLSLTQQEMLAAYLGQQSNQQDVFAVLNTSGLQDMAVVWIPADVEVETPIHCLFLSMVDPDPALIHPRLLVVAEANSRVTFVESYGAIAVNCTDRPQQQPYCNNIVSEIYVEENAQVTHVRNQRDSGDSFHFATTAIAQARHSHYRLFDINLGAKLSRHTLVMNQQGEQTQTDFFALTALAGRQVSDTHSSINLRYPHGTTNQLHKCIVDDYAQAVFSGKVLVPQAAQLTNACQLNRNLVLSSKARINTKPELQITADNVKCSHGATISQLEADEVFYLRSRGLNDYDARHLLIDAFAGEILDQIPLKSLQQRLRQCLACRTI
ncbi:MAG: Fe-S cluster assembly protein SufD [Synechocystis sp.]|nr:Fe-S cluster assembly protein SufD [Synechocystis sp.]